MDAAFPFSRSKKQDALRVLEALKTGPKTFKELQEGLGLGKSALFYLLVALSAAGLVVKPEGKGKPYALNAAFSEELAAFAEWWRVWLRL